MHKCGPGLRGTSLPTSLPEERTSTLPHSLPSGPAVPTRIYRQQRRHLGGELTEPSRRTEAPEEGEAARGHA